MWAQRHPVFSPGSGAEVRDLSKRMAKTLRYRDEARRKRLKVHGEGWFFVEEVARVLEVHPGHVSQVVEECLARHGAYRARYELKNVREKWVIRALTKSEHLISQPTARPSTVPIYIDDDDDDVGHDGEGVTLDGYELFQPQRRPRTDAEVPAVHGEDSGVGEALFHHVICPITHEVMDDPVVAADGHTYERTAIEMWFGQSNNSPVTNNSLNSLVLYPNHAIRSVIKAFYRP